MSELEVQNLEDVHAGPLTAAEGESKDHLRTSQAWSECVRHVFLAFGWDFAN